MKQLKCEMCGSTDLVKQDGMFVCQVCGTRYSVEEAKKMMIEGTVEVQGTVKVDNSDELSNLYQIARRAKDDNNSENAAKYYDMILVKDPTSWEASFYVVYFKAQNCTIAQIKSAAISIYNCIDSVLLLIKEHVPTKKEQIKAVNEVAQHCLDIATNLFVSGGNFYAKHLGSTQKTAEESIKNIHGISSITIRIFDALGDDIDRLFGEYESLHETSTKSWELGIQNLLSDIRFVNSILSHWNTPSFLQMAKEDEENIVRLSNKIKKYNSSYQHPEIPQVSTQGNGGCYVATCVYGSYDCPEVWTLRRYRDNVLGSTRLGRVFIKCYYAISPILVKWFGHTKWFKKMWRKKLDKMVQNLQEQGIENTPYQDIDWRKKACVSKKEK